MTTFKAVYITPVIVDVFHCLCFDGMQEYISYCVLMCVRSVYLCYEEEGPLCYEGDGPLIDYTGYF